MRARTWLIGGALLLVPGGGWVAAQGIADIGAAALVQALQATLPPGSEIRYGAVAADPLGRSARFSDITIRLGPTTAPQGRLRADALELAGSLEATMAGRFATVRGQAVTVEDGAGGHLALATLAASNVAPAALADLADGRLSGTAATGPLAATGLEVGSAQDRVTVARLAWDALADGRITGLSLEDAAGSTGAGDRYGFARLGLNALDWTRIDREALADAMARLSAPSATPTAGAASKANGAPVRAPSAPGDDDLFTAGTEAFLALAEGQLGGFQLDGLSVTPADPAQPAIRFGRMALGELSLHRMGPLTLDRLDVSDPDARVSAGDLTYDVQIDRFPLEAARAALAELRRTGQGGQRLRTILAGVEGRYAMRLANLAATRPSDGAGIALNGLTASANAAANRDSTSIRLESFAMDLAKLLNDVGDQARLTAAGLGRVTGRMNSTWGTDRAAHRASLDALTVELDNLAAIEAQGEIATPATPPPNPLAALVSFGLVRARLAYADHSLLNRLLSGLGQEGATPATTANDLAGLVADPARTPWLDAPSRTALADFLRRPGRLEIELAPKAPVPAPQLLQLAFGTPATLPATLGLRIRSLPPAQP